MPVFEDGFESGDFAGWSSTSGAPTVTTNMPHHGTYGFESTPGTTAAFCRKTGLSLGLTYMRAYFMFTDVPGVSKQFSCGPYMPGTGVYLAQCYLYNSGGILKWGMQYRTGGAYSGIQLSNQQTNPTINTWYCMELMVDPSTADGTADGAYKLYIDDSELSDISASGIDTDATAVIEARITTYENAATTPTFYFDCVVVDTSYIGPEVTASATRRMNLLNTSLINSTRYFKSLKPRMVV